ncbi:sensor histidine kinase [Jiangella alkaliphila]|uniref:Oxygen sensor histidine kinase NreB n=1 Tax=Jiangella alkaliphila TaxID=419479 RepID=A0A1H2GYX6_9ACTN|nr:sensor histidine kinase [Jiangella alkaliphila]SDU24786.1 Signal transduction histidine kinase [Jiangella alkaliphila]
MAREPQPWEQWKTEWQHAFFVVALGLASLGAVTSSTEGVPAAARLGFAAGLGAWYGYWFVLRPDASVAHLPYLLGAAALWAVMAALDPALLWVGAVAVVPYCMRHAWWAAAGFVVLGGAWLWQRFATEGALDWSTVLGCALGVVAVAAISGYIAMLDREGRRRQALLEELAAAHAELAAAERQAGRLAERQRLARDIHDTLTQGFASISMLLDAALADLPPDGPAQRRIDQAIRTARENLAESRRLVEALRPVHLDDARLPDAVRQLTSRLTDETGVAADTVITGTPVGLDPTVEATMLRVIQEALTNARRHAAADTVTVTISYLDDVVVVDVHDDGLGFNTSARSPGVGLPAMRERVDGVGGALTIESTPGDGTTVAVTVPATATSRVDMVPDGDSVANHRSPASP